MNDTTEANQVNNHEEMSEEMKSYRLGLIETQRKLNESYDKLIITLSGGSLALSITFLKDIIGSNQINQPFCLLIAWILFVVSLTAILCEILFGIKAHKKAITQVDDGSIHDKKVGGKFSSISTITHWIASISLVSGLFFISIFTFNNLGGLDGKKNTPCTQTSTQTKSAEKS